MGIAYHARKKFPENRIFITDEIIHNPSINQNLRDLKIQILPHVTGGEGEGEKKAGEGRREGRKRKKEQ